MKAAGAKTAVILAAVLVLTVFGLVRLTGCAPGTPETNEPGSAPAATPLSQEGTDSTPPGSDAESDTPSTVIEHLTVQVYYPAATGEGLVAELHEIFNTATPGDRAKQIVADLISGPTTEYGLRAIPPGTQLRQVFVLDNGVAFVDLSRDFEQAIGGGSTQELLAVYSIVNSLALNIPDIRRVGILIDGRPVETLNGHMDLRRPLPPDTSMISSEMTTTIVQAPFDRDVTAR